MKLNAPIMVLLTAAFCTGITACGSNAKKTTQAQGLPSQQPAVEQTSAVDKMNDDDNDDAETVFNFDQDVSGKLPAGWRIAHDASGDYGVWSVVKDEDAASKPNVLFQSGHDRKGNQFNLAIAREQRYKDTEVELLFKAIAGDEDQGGGPVWRYKDAGNYYVCRANPLENNFRVYKVVNGHRKEMQSADVKIPTAQWHTIKASMVGHHIKCWLNGKLYLELDDETFDQGNIGVWTKADAQTYFDNVEVEPANDED